MPDLTVLTATLVIALVNLNADTRRVNNAHLSLLVIIFGKCLLELAQLIQLVVLLLPFTRVNASRHVRTGDAHKRVAAFECSSLTMCTARGRIVTDLADQHIGHRCQGQYTLLRVFSPGTLLRSRRSIEIVLASVADDIARRLGTLDRAYPRYASCRC